MLVRNSMGEVVMFRSDVVTCIILSTLWPLSSKAESISISGNVIATPCLISTGTIDQTIDFGQMIATNFIKPNSVSEWKKFAFNLTQCPSATNAVSVTFTGRTDANNALYFYNSASGRNAALQITNEDHSVTYSNGSVEEVLIDASRNATFQLAARVISPMGNMTSGDFTSVVQVSFTYR